MPFYSKYVPSKDGWGGFLQYDSGAIGSIQSCYSIISYGRDGISTGIDINNNGYLITSVKGFNNDICFSNGVFTHAPKMK
jgi:hypothetical protein